MSETAAVWGVHVVQGAVTAVLLRSTGTDSFEILDAIAERTREDPAEALQHACAILSRRGVAGRGASVALPDANGCLVTATIPPDELDLSEHEISNEMYEWTPFEPDQAELRHQCVVREGRRQERLVAALPRSDYRRFLEILEAGDSSRLGVGLSGAATWRGARAMGLVPPDGFLVSTLPHATEVFAAPGGRVRRHLLAIGESHLTHDATAVDLLARDLAQLADYYRSLRRGDERPPLEPRFALAGLSATSPSVRQRLSAVLGPRLIDGPVADVLVTVAPKAKMPHVPVAALAGAVGAALEALRPVEERLVLRHVPTNLPPYRERSPLAYVAVISILATAGAFAFEHFHATSKASPSLPPPEHPSEPRSRSPEVEPATNAAGDPAAAPKAAETAPATETAPSLAAETTTMGRVHVKWPAGGDGRILHRRFLGRDGSGSAEEAVEVRRVGAGAGELTDDVPGPTGLYAWSVDGAAEARVFVEIRVEIELLGPGDAGGARFALRRPWREATASLAVDVAPGAHIAGADGALAFDSGWRLDAVRTRAESERAAVRVPRFLADGRIERGPGGGAVTGERVVERERRIFEADGIAPDGSRRTWSRKMTDG